MRKYLIVMINRREVAYIDSPNTGSANKSNDSKQFILGWKVKRKKQGHVNFSK